MDERWIAKEKLMNANQERAQTDPPAIGLNNDKYNRVAIAVSQEAPQKLIGTGDAGKLLTHARDN